MQDYTQNFIYQNDQSIISSCFMSTPNLEYVVNIQKYTQVINWNISTCNRKYQPD